MSFQKPFPRSVLGGSQCQTFLNKLSLLPFSIFGIFQKGTVWTTCSHKVFTFAVSCSGFGRPCRDPAFHETMVITMPFGPSVFFNHLSMESGLLIVFCAFLCATFLYTLFITSVHNTTVNAQPLSPTMFEKIAQHFNLLLFVMLVLYVCVFSNCS